MGDRQGIRRVVRSVFFHLAVWWVYESAEPRVKCSVNAKPRNGVDVLGNLILQQLILLELHTLSKAVQFSPHSKYGGQHLWEPGTNRKFSATGSLRHFTPTSCTSNNSFIASHSRVKRERDCGKSDSQKVLICMKSEGLIIPCYSRQVFSSLAY